MNPAIVPLEAWRNARFGEEYYFTDDAGASVDFTAYTAKLQVRQYGAQAGAAIIDLANVGTDVEGVRILEPALGIIRVRIDEATLTAAYAALIGGNEAGSAIALVYDLIVTPPGAGDQPWMQGSFTINPGVTI